MYLPMVGRKQNKQFPQESTAVYGLKLHLQIHLRKSYIEMSAFLLGSFNNISQIRKINVSHPNDYTRTSEFRHNTHSMFSSQDVGSLIECGIKNFFGSMKNG